MYHIDIMRVRSQNSSFVSRSPLVVRLVRRHSPIVVFLVVGLAGMLVTYWYFTPNKGSVEAVTVAGMGANDPSALSAPIFKQREPKPVTQRLAQSPSPIRVGIIAGHKGYDSGTVCEDGLTEVQITTNMAAKLAARLQNAGIPADIFDEFDPRLDGYSSSALVSIHVDSCEFVNDLATGFKIAGSSYTDSSALSICMQRSYAESTKLGYHPDSITPHMADYHVFREISPGTPAIIIEVGFLYLDRDLLTTGSEIPVEGLANGVFCFLERAP